MESPEAQRLFLEVVSTSPIAAVLGVWAYLTRKDVKDKDSEIRELHKSTLTAFKENTQAITEMKGAISTNTDVTKTLVTVFKNSN